MQRIIVDDEVAEEEALAVPRYFSRHSRPSRSQQQPRRCGGGLRVGGFRSYKGHSTRNVILIRDTEKKHCLEPEKKATLQRYRSAQGVERAHPRQRPTGHIAPIME